jgi:hypothetical protein
MSKNYKQLMSKTTNYKWSNHDVKDNYNTSDQITMSKTSSGTNNRITMPKTATTSSIYKPFAGMLFLLFWRFCFLFFSFRRTFGNFSLFRVSLHDKTQRS